MPDYTKNNQNALGGHTEKDVPPTVMGGRTSKLDEMADVRDLLSAMVGAGKGGLRPDDQAAVIARLQTVLGKPVANKLINQAAIFNERTDVSRKTAEQRINQFYDMGSRDPEINTLIQRTAMLGQGPVSGADQSSNDLTNKVIGGANVLAAPASANPSSITQVQGQLGGL